MTDSNNSLSHGSQNILDVCQGIRLACSELHHFYADLFVGDRNTMLLWKRIAMEEENYAKEFTLISRLGRQNIIQSFLVDLVDAQIALIYVRSLIDKAKDAPPSLADALKLSISLEEKLSPYNLHQIVKLTDPSFRKLFGRVIRADENRISSIRKALEELVNPAPDKGFQSDVIW